MHLSAICIKSYMFLICFIFKYLKRWWNPTIDLYLTSSLQINTLSLIWHLLFLYLLALLLHLCMCISNVQ